MMKIGSIIKKLENKLRKPLIFDDISYAKLASILNDEVEPSIDELQIISNFFGLSIDDFLNFSETSALNIKTTYTRKFLLKSLFLVFTPLAIFALLFAFIFFFIGITRSLDVAIYGGLTMVLFIVLLFILQIFSLNKRISTQGVAVLTHTFDEKGMCTYIYSPTTPGQQRFNYETISKFIVRKKIIAVFILNQHIAINPDENSKEDIDQMLNYLSLNLSKAALDKSDTQKKPRLSLGIDLLLSLGQLFAIFSPFIVFLLFSQPGSFEFQNYSWVAWPALIVPIIAVILGYLEIKKGYKSKRQLVLGIISAIILLFIGLIGIVL